MAETVKGQPPKKPARPSSYSEGENESPQLIENEPVDMERDVPEEDNEPVEREERQEKPDTPIFEE